MSSPAWDNIPLLALKCIIENLDVKDALAATSTCCHWRSAMLMYEGRRDLLKLRGRELKKSEYLVKIFKKHVRRLHIYINIKATEALKTFMCSILPHFLDSINLQEMVFIGPLYLNQSWLMPIAKLRRVIIETLGYKHAHVLESLAIIGCDISVVDETDRYANSQVEYYSKTLSFEKAEPLSPTSLENQLLSRKNINMMMFSNIKHLVFEYELISTEALITLSKLDNLAVLSLNFMRRKGMKLPKVDWGAVNPLFTKGLDVAVNLICLSESCVQHIVENALSSEMPVTTLKVMYCRDISNNLVLHVAHVYGDSLMELVWADLPTPAGTRVRVVRTDLDENARGEVNPFIFLSWQCHQLQRLVIHGYWLCEYDLLGVTRLRPGLDLVVSSIYDSTTRPFEFPTNISGGNLLRVMTTDDEPRIRPPPKGVYMANLNEVQRRQLTPKDWTSLHPGLKMNASHTQISEYLLSEILQPLGVT